MSAVTVHEKTLAEKGDIPVEEEECEYVDQEEFFLLREGSQKKIQAKLIGFWARMSLSFFIRAMGDEGGSCIIYPFFNTAFHQGSDG